MEIQAALGADVVMAFDQCAALPAQPGQLSDAVDRSSAWARRCLEAFGRTRIHPAGHEQALFGIVQGGLDEELRGRSESVLLLVHENTAILLPRTTKQHSPA